MTPQQRHPTQTQQEPAPEKSRASSLVARLGLKALSDHIDELGLFFLIGRAYHQGARSLRCVARMLCTPPARLPGDDMAPRVASEVPRSLRAIHEAVAALEVLAGEQLVNRTGEGLGYDGLTPAGEQFWGLTAQLVRELWG